MLFAVCSFVSLSMGLSACNSSGHLSNHADVAPNHAGVTFAISNTLVFSDQSFLLTACYHNVFNVLMVGVFFIYFSVNYCAL